VVKHGKMPVLLAEEARELLDSIDGDTLIGLHDRALIATMVYSIARHRYTRLPLIVLHNVSQRGVEAILT
jgi:hypothetical protein